MLGSTSTGPLGIQLYICVQLPSRPKSGSLPTRMSISNLVKFEEDVIPTAVAVRSPLHRLDTVKVVA